MEVKCHCNKTKLTEEENGPPPPPFVLFKKVFHFYCKLFYMFSRF